MNQIVCETYQEVIFCNDEAYTKAETAAAIFAGYATALQQNLDNSKLSRIDQQET